MGKGTNFAFMDGEIICEMSSLETTVLALIRRFVSRLRIVQFAIKELHPQLILHYRGVTDSQEREKFIRDYWRTTRGLGMWQNTWKYRVHGIGCELIHIRSGEPLHWDMGHRNRFDKSWFADYVFWYIRDRNSDISVVSILSHIEEFTIDNVTKVVFQVLEILASKNYLHDLGHRSVLLE